MFQEEYKKLDNLCRDCYSSIDGISEYIRRMENEQDRSKMLIASWEDDYKMLKHVRWIRNKLSHEVGTLQSNICTQDDLDFVINFYDKIIKCTDPLTQIRILKEDLKKTKHSKSTVSTGDAIKQSESKIKNNTRSVFSKLFKKIKNLFS